ncbi:MAG TPA: serine/threonine-protein kinase [Gemmatimonadales bacterium]|jgi:serine/threonine-protein kinase|nr:serine/threonine-protein kinase [Gemmatimonadales bacterium]
MARDLLATVQTALGRRYTVEAEIGRGGGARVFRARDTSGTLVALKVLHPELLVSVAADRFLREIEFARKLEHPHIARLLDTGEEGWLVYYTMAFAEGPSLRQQLEASGPLDLGQTQRLATEILGALAYAHGKGVIHRDVKPENVVLTAAGAILLDFGIARAVEVSGGDRLTRSGTTLGTATYMSPEQIRGARDMDQRTDLYATACLIYEACVGKPPFHHANPMFVMQQHLTQTAPDLRDAIPTAPASMAEAIARALAKVPAERWASADAMLAGLRGVAVAG